MTIKLIEIHPILVPTPNNEQPFIISITGLTDGGEVVAYNPALRKWDQLSMELVTVADRAAIQGIEIVQ